MRRLLPSLIALSLLGLIALPTPAQGGTCDDIEFAAIVHEAAPEEVPAAVQEPPAVPEPPPVVDETPVVQEPVDDGPSNLLLILAFVLMVAILLMIISRRRKKDDEEA